MHFATPSLPPPSVTTLPSPTHPVCIALHSSSVATPRPPEWPQLAAPHAHNVGPQGNACSAGDSAAYERRGGSLDDVVIISALRTPICKAKRGGLRDTPADDLLATVLKATLQQTGVEPAVRQQSELISSTAVCTSRLLCCM